MVLRPERCATPGAHAPCLPTRQRAHPRSEFRLPWPRKVASNAGGGCGLAFPPRSVPIPGHSNIRSPAASEQTRQRAHPSSEFHFPWPPTCPAALSGEAGSFRAIQRGCGLAFPHRNVPIPGNSNIRSPAASEQTRQRALPGSEFRLPWPLKLPSEGRQSVSAFDSPKFPTLLPLPAVPSHPKLA